MKLTKLACILVATTCLSTAIFAKEPKASVGDKLMGVGSGMVIGALAGGPFGAVIGAAVGDSITEKFAMADQAEANEAALITAQQEIELLRQQLAANQPGSESINSSSYWVMGENQTAQFPVLFHTAESRIPASHLALLDHWATILTANPALQIQLDGYADQRGSDSTNHQLSLARAQAVKQYLASAGIDPQRISVIAHGKQEASAAQGNLDGYALDRQVVVTLSTNENTATVAQN
ncbi:OmpA family protein [Endozoicomonas sp. SM1973]|uniref:OmpA family protein n=1 Tax=Spartinivicinus marinus TaxID=2994442 RepID=A0A853IDP5_9GAMM|nr:OmpA family protein [Spartinivicinus marinus]MCX4028861.1 OmpA family protein [Spartinivicinus marinus]NYZ65556.1 OmpA family protein [Spartinivicinus marinus]